MAARSLSTATSTPSRPSIPTRWVNGSPWNPEIRDDRLYGIGSTDMKGSDAAMWLVAQALADAGVELEGDLLLHSVVGEETMQHELGTSAVLEAGFTRRRRHRHRADVDPAPVDGLADRRGQLVLPHPRRGQCHPLRQPGARDPPGGPGDAIGVNALEKAVQIVVALQDLEQQWGMTKSHPYFMPGFFSMLPGVFHADPGLDIPFYFSTSCRDRVLALVSARRVRRRRCERRSRSTC